MAESSLERFIEREQVSKEKPKKKVLIIDDSKSYCKIITAFIGVHAPKCEIREAHSHYFTLKTLKRGYAPDLITVDFKLPDMDGVRLAQEIYKINEIFPIIIITSGNLNDIMKYVRKAPDHNIKRVFSKSEINNFAQWMVDKYIHRKSYLASGR